LVLDVGAGFIALVVGGALAHLLRGMIIIQPWLIFISGGRVYPPFSAIAASRQP
jgi:hypothetical protein